ncbi:MAG: hypothetical protein FWE79_00150, partial [Firmicutes bacterium]|nr:hypothetical protein [Bacillota bacterium]
YIAGVELSVSTLWCPNCQKIIGGEFDVCPRCSKAELKKLNFHLLGYSFDVNNKPLNEKLNILLEERKIKYNKIVKALGEQKQIELPQVFIDRMIADKAGKNVGSSDIANLLIKLAYVKNIQGAFEHYIKQLKYDDIKLCLLEAIELIRRAGGLTVLAHPIIMMWNYGFTYSEMEAFIIELRKHGVTGLEVFFAENTKTHTDEFKAIARRQGLFMTGGSDFHGYKYHKHLHLGKIGPA